MRHQGCCHSTDHAHPSAPASPVSAAGALSPLRFSYLEGLPTRGCPPTLVCIRRYIAEATTDPPVRAAAFFAIVCPANCPLPSYTLPQPTAVLCLLPLNTVNL